MSNGGILASVNSCMPNIEPLLGYLFPFYDRAQHNECLGKVWEQYVWDVLPLAVRLEIVLVIFLLFYKEHISVFRGRQVYERA